MNTWVSAGDPPLRYFKNDYDKPPISYVPKHQSCTIPAGKGPVIPADEATQTSKGYGRSKPDFPEISLRSLQNAEPWIKKTLSMEDDDPDVDYYASFQQLCMGKDGAFP